MSVLFDLIFKWPGKFQSVDSMLLMETPIPIVTILALYLYYVIIYGPKLMKNRKPMKIRSAIIPYNIFQIIACVLIIIGVTKLMNA